MFAGLQTTYPRQRLLSFVRRGMSICIVQCNGEVGLRRIMLFLIKPKKNVGMYLKHLIREDEITLDDSFNSSSIATTVFTPSAQLNSETNSSSAQKSASTTPSPPIRIADDSRAQSPDNNPVEDDSHIDEIPDNPNSTSNVNPSTNLNSSPNASPVHVISHLRSTTTRSSFHEEKPPSPELVYMNFENLGIGDLLNGHVNSVSVKNPAEVENSHYVPSPPSPPHDTWDFFNLFSSTETPYYMFQSQRLSHVYDNEEFTDLKKLREEEGIPELEEVGPLKEKEDIKGKRVEESTVPVSVAASKVKNVSQGSSEAGNSKGEPSKDKTGNSKPAKELKEENTDKETHKEEGGTGQTKEESNDQEPSKRGGIPSQFKKGNSLEPSKEGVTSEPKVDALPGKSPEQTVRVEEEDKAEEDDEVKVENVVVAEKPTDTEKAEETQFGKKILPPITSVQNNMSQIMHYINEQFMTAYKAGNKVSRLLEISRLHHSNIQDQSGEVTSSIMNAPRSLSSLTHSLRFSSLRDSSFRTFSLRNLSVSSHLLDNMDDSNSDLAEDCGMLSGSHASTLERLYTWEKKIYDQVKAGEQLRIMYAKLCRQLKLQESKGVDNHLIEKTRFELRNNQTETKVSVKKVKDYADKVAKLRAEELLPQLQELITGLMEMWSVMLACYQTQFQIISETKLCSESNPKLTIELVHEVRCWHRSFKNLFISQKAYVQALSGWLMKCLTPDAGVSPEDRKPSSPHIANENVIFTACRYWVNALDQMSDEAAVDAIKCFVKNLQKLLQKQEEEQKQKKKVQRYEKEFHKRKGNLKKVETRRYQRKQSIEESESADPLIERKKISLESMRKLVEDEKAKHDEILNETQNMIFNDLQNGLASIFKALTDFAAVSCTLYKHLYENFLKTK
eukprot:TRINITY_DN2436_c0_g1_i1.p1 TRINITY_DN2436_c0_g1~~TRINITY_DN2436_c0_g1_i1.p1  ORF type:complete len:901 (+),score=192.97 TRINITY_DN2436_c0_g1_i1:282-2984(+)